MLLSTTTVLAAVAFSILYNVLGKIVAFRKAIHSIGNFPGVRYVLGPGNALSYFVPWTVPGVVAGTNFLFRWKYQPCKETGMDIFTFISAYPKTRTIFYLADPQAVKEVTLARARFPKPTQYYQVLSFFGRNIVVSEHEEWKRFRKVCAPSFSERNNKLVWDETVRVVNELVEDVWGPEDKVEVEDATELTLSIALFVISIAGFGQRISWKDEGVRLPGYQMSFRDAIVNMSTAVLTKAIIPEWLLKLGLTKRMREVNVAFRELRGYMLDMIEKRRASEKKVECYDLFSSLLDASAEEANEDSRLSDSELMGNIFMFLVAGHETTAHTLGFSLALLALYQDEQEKLYQQIKSLLPDGAFPNYSDISAYTCANAVIYETLRLFPIATAIPKYSAEDTTLRTVNAAGEAITVNIPKGSDVVFNTPALHYNPRYWDDPEEFRPSRFLEDWPRDAFLPFSGGPRACIGRRFAEVESIAVLVMLVSRYHIDVADDPRFASETLEARRARLLRCSSMVTLTPKRVPIVFKRRK